MVGAAHTSGAWALMLPLALFLLIASLQLPWLPLAKHLHLNAAANKSLITLARFLVVLQLFLRAFTVARSNSPADDMATSQSLSADLLPTSQNMALQNSESHSRHDRLACLLYRKPRSSSATDAILTDNNNNTDNF